MCGSISIAMPISICTAATDRDFAPHGALSWGGQNPPVMTAKTAQVPLTVLPTLFGQMRAAWVSYEGTCSLRPQAVRDVRPTFPVTPSAARLDRAPAHLRGRRDARRRGSRTCGRRRRLLA